MSEPKTRIKNIGKKLEYRPDTVEKYEWLQQQSESQRRSVNRIINEAIDKMLFTDKFD